MIFGKSYKEKHDEEQEKLKKLVNKIWFAWYPIKENYGRLVWFQRVKVNYGIYKFNYELCKSYKKPIYDLI